MGSFPYLLSCFVLFPKYMEMEMVDCLRCECCDKLQYFIGRCVHLSNLISFVGPTTRFLVLGFFVCASFYTAFVQMTIEQNVSPNIETLALNVTHDNNLIITEGEMFFRNVTHQLFRNCGSNDLFLGRLVKKNVMSQVGQRLDKCWVVVHANILVFSNQFLMKINFKVQPVQPLAFDNSFHSKLKFNGKSTSFQDSSVLSQFTIGVIVGLDI